MTHSPTFTWRFAPTGGGAEQGNSAGQHYFANDAITKMVRETLQNSLDRPTHGVETVDITFRLIHISPEDIGAGQLKEHIRSSLQEVTSDHDTDAINRYEKMIASISQPSIPCLAVIDSGTTGLQGKNWRNLIFREGTPTNTEGQTKGGSYGFGKNAPFNLSACNTVIYSTRYVSIAEKGRVEHMVGRAQLVSHDHPSTPYFRLQQTGFLALHREEQPNQPVAGPEIPHPFRLNHQGTGIFIIAFDTKTYYNWITETAKATATQFFYAIHAGKMTVTIDQGDGSPHRVINHDTLEMELENYPENESTRHYYRAIIDNQPDLTVPSGRLGQMGRMQIWISTAKDAPRKTAHINRRGMLITDVRLVANNPFHPSGGAGWPHWCAVTMAEDEAADQFLRRMEPPAHDAIHFRQLRDPAQQQSAEIELREQREQISKLVKNRIDDTLNDASNNVNELADLFPDLPDLSQGVHNLNWRERQISERLYDVVEIKEESEDSKFEDDPDGNHEVEDGQEWSSSNGGGGGNGGGSNQFTDSGTHKANPKPSGSAISRTRIIRTAPGELVMTLVTPHEPIDSITFGIRAAGEQYQKHETSIPIVAVAQTGNLLVKAELQENSIVLSAPPDTPVTLHLQLDGNQVSYQSYSIVQIDRKDQKE